MTTVEVYRDDELVLNKVWIDVNAVALHDAASRGVEIDVALPCPRCGEGRTIDLSMAPLDFHIQGRNDPDGLDGWRTASQCRDCYLIRIEDYYFPTEGGPFAALAMIDEERD